jgi:hypothetical protein
MTERQQADEDSTGMGQRDPVEIALDFVRAFAEWKAHRDV